MGPRSTPLVRRRWAVWLAALALVTTAAACGDDGEATGSDAPAEPVADQSDEGWDAVVAAAEEEGTVNVYISQGMDDALLEEAFAEMYPGVDVVITRESTAVLLGTLDQEAGAGAAGADVTWHVSAPWYESTGEAGNMGELPDGPHAEEWADLETTHDTYFEVQQTPTVIATNTDELEPVETFEDLLDPELSGRVGFVSATASPASVFEFDLKLDEFGPDFISDLAANDARVYPNSPPLAQALGAGEIGVAFATTAGSFTPLIDQGAPLEIRVPDVGTQGAAQQVGIVGWSTHPNAGAVFVDFLMSPEGQEAAIEAVDGFAASQHPDVDAGVDYEALVPFVSSEWPQPAVDEWLAQEWTDYFG